MGTSDLNEHTLVTAEAPDNQLSCSLPFGHSSIESGAGVLSPLTGLYWKHKKAIRVPSPGLRCAPLVIVVECQ